MCSQIAFAALSALEDANIAINEIEWIGIGSPVPLTMYQRHDYLFQQSALSPISAGATTQ